MWSSGRSILAAAALMASAFACEGPGRASSSTVTTAAADDTRATPSAATSVSDAAAPTGVAATDGHTQLWVYDDGSEPRRSLHYELRRGDRLTGTMPKTLNMEITGRVLRKQQVKERFEATVVDVDAAGTASCQLHIHRTTPGKSEEWTRSGTGQESRPVLDMFDTLMVLRPGTSEVRVTSRGETVPSEPATRVGSQERPHPAGGFAPPYQLAVPFPDEPVGVGAQWGVDRRVLIGGLLARDLALYEITAIDGPRIELRYKLRMIVPGQPIDRPGRDPDEPTDVPGVDFSLEGALTVDLRRLPWLAAGASAVYPREVLVP
jgi:hypothetical protein